MQHSHLPPLSTVAWQPVPAAPDFDDLYYEHAVEKLFIFPSHMVSTEEMEETFGLFGIIPQPRFMKYQKLADILATIYWHMLEDNVEIGYCNDPLLALVDDKITVDMRSLYLKTFDIALVRDIMIATGLTGLRHWLMEDVVQMLSQGDWIFHATTCELFNNSNVTVDLLWIEEHADAVGFTPLYTGDQLRTLSHDQHHDQCQLYARHIAPLDIVGFYDEILTYIDLPWLSEAGMSSDSSRNDIVA